MTEQQASVLTWLRWLAEPVDQVTRRIRPVGRVRDPRLIRAEWPGLAAAGWVGPRAEGGGITVQGLEALRQWEEVASAAQ